MSFLLDSDKKKSTYTFIVGSYLVIPVNITEFKEEDFPQCFVYHQSRPLFQETCDSRILKILVYNDINVIRPVDKKLCKIECLVFKDPNNGEKTTIPLWHSF